MKAVMATAAGKLGLGELTVPVPAENQALVKMEACGICNSTDVKLMKGEMMPGVFPVALGHEVIGTVVSVGSKVIKFKEGDRVFRQRLDDAHITGGGRSRWGGFAEYALVTDPLKEEDPPGPQQKLLIDVEPALAAGMVTLMETLDVIASSVGAAPGKSVAVVGSGPVAQAFALFAKLFGAGPVAVFARKATHADRFSKVATCDDFIVGETYSEAVTKVIRSGGYDSVLEAAGTDEALGKCQFLAGTRGKVHVYGIAPQSNPYSEEKMSRPNTARVSPREGRAQPRLVEFVKSGKVRLEDWVSHRLPLSEYQKGFDLVERKKALKVVLVSKIS